MMRIVIPFVAALGLSLGVSTGVVMMRAPAHPAHPAPAAAKANDSTHTAAHPDSTHAAGDSAAAPKDSTHVTDGATAVANAAGPKAAPTGSPEAGAPKGASEPTKGPEASGAKVIPVSAQKAPAPAVRSDSTEKRLAKVFGAMQSKDAAHILQQMEDVDVRTILASLSPKQQAAILGQFPAQRAASLTRAALRNDGSDQ